MRQPRVYRLVALGVVLAAALGGVARATAGPVVPQRVRLRYRLRRFGPSISRSVALGTFPAA